MTKLKLTKIVVNCETGEQIEREFTTDEYAQYEADQAAEAQRQSETEAKTIARKNILDRLGISTEEARILLG